MKSSDAAPVASDDDDDDDVVVKEIEKWNLQNVKNFYADLCRASFTWKTKPKETPAAAVKTDININFTLMFPSCWCAHHTHTPSTLVEEKKLKKRNYANKSQRHVSLYSPA